MPSRKRARHGLALAAAAVAFLCARGSANEAGEPGEPEIGEIVGGEVVAGKPYPFIASLQRSSDSGFEHFCGGTLIHPEYVLTAGHCVKRGDSGKPDRLQFMQYDLDGKAEAGAVDATVEKVLLAPGFYGVQNDAALLKLAKPVGLETVRLARPSQAGVFEAPGKMLRVAGWGFTEAGGPRTSDKLRHVDVPVALQETCRASYPNLEDNTMCAGYAEGGRDSCSGDSGGPLFLKESLSSGLASFRQVGIVSYGSGCAAKDMYGVYARVSAHIAWIESVVGPLDENNAAIATSQPTTAFPTVRPTTAYPTTAYPTKRPTLSPVTPKPTLAPTPPTMPPSYNAADCYIPRTNPGWLRGKRACQLPFYFQDKSGVTTRFDYPPTFAEADPWGTDRLSGITAGDPVMRWCPPDQFSTYLYNNVKTRKSWGVAVCTYSHMLPTATPTSSPVKSTGRPTASPTKRPTSAPSRSPTPRPTGAPTLRPTRNPTKSPTPRPTRAPSRAPTRRPTGSPTRRPSRAPTRSPTSSPTRAPTTQSPTRAPSLAPTTVEYGMRDAFCKSMQTARECSEKDWWSQACDFLGGKCRGRLDTNAPTAAPTRTPTGTPTAAPTRAPSRNPTEQQSGIGRPETEDGGGQEESNSGASAETAIISIAASLGCIGVFVMAGSFFLVRRRKKAREQTAAEPAFQIAAPIAVYHGAGFDHFGTGSGPPPPPPPLPPPPPPPGMGGHNYFGNRESRFQARV